MRLRNYLPDPEPVPPGSEAVRMIPHDSREAKAMITWAHIQFLTHGSGHAYFPRNGEVTHSQAWGRVTQSNPWVGG